LYDLLGIDEGPEPIPWENIDGTVPIYMFSGMNDDISTASEALWIEENIPGW
jgi:hypothetical protein